MRVVGCDAAMLVTIVIVLATSLPRYAEKSSCRNPPAGLLSRTQHYIAAIVSRADDTAFLQGGRGAAQPRAGMHGMHSCAIAMCDSHKHENMTPPTPDPPPFSPLPRGGCLDSVNTSMPHAARVRLLLVALPGRSRGHVGQPSPAQPGRAAAGGADASVGPGHCLRVGAAGVRRCSCPPGLAR